MALNDEVVSLEDVREEEERAGAVEAILASVPVRSDADAVDDVDDELGLSSPRLTDDDALASEEERAAEDYRKSMMEMELLDDEDGRARV